MEEKSPSVLKEFGPLVIYHDEIKELKQILEDHNGPTEIEIKLTNKEYTAKSAEDVERIPEIPTNKQTIRSLTINSHGKIYVRVKLTNHDASLYLSEYGLIAPGLEHQIKKIVNPRGKIYQSLFMGTIIPSVVFGMALISLGKDISTQAAAVTLLAAAWNALAWINNFKHYSRIHLKPKSDSPSILRDKKGDIILWTLGSLPGVVATYILTKFG